MSVQNICQKTISIFSVTLTHLMLVPQSTVANPANLQSLSISQPTITPNWLSLGKFRCYLSLILKRSRSQSRLTNLRQIGQ
jgi:hypothetical protein